MTKAFISYHHRNDQEFKEHLDHLSLWHNAFDDCSVKVGDISDDLSTQTIRTRIRDHYLRDSKVTVLLCGSETKYRKHVDWELKSSMIDGAVNKKSGILVIDLPSSANTGWTSALPMEKEIIHPDYSGGWRTIERKSDYLETYPDLPERIIDNLLNDHATISVVPWEKVENNPKNLKFLIDETAKTALNNRYDLSLPMRMRDHNPRGLVFG